MNKRIIISLIFIAIVGLISFLLYLVVTPPATCSDKKQNQKEKAIDCGGPCSPCKTSQATEMIIQEKAVVFGGNNTYDVVAKIYNPNDSIGANQFKFEAALKDSNGVTVATSTNKSFILPVDAKYITILGIKTENDAVPVSVEIAIGEIEWLPLGNLEKPQLGVYNKKFDKAPMGEGSEAEGLLRNESNYDLNKISIVIVLRDNDGKIVGVNTTEKNVVRVKEQRDFRLSWPYALAGNVQKMEVDVQSNVLDPQNFSVIR